MKIPEYNPRVGATGSGEVATIRAFAQEGGTDDGRGLLALGQGFEQAAQSATAIRVRQLHEEEKKHNEDSLHWALNKMSQVRAESMTDYQARLEAMPHGGGDFAGEVDKAYKERLKKALDEAPNSKAKSILEAKGYEYSNSVFAHAISAQATERSRAKIQDNKDSIDRDALVLARDPMQFDTMVQDRLKTFEALGAATKDGLSTYMSKEFMKAIGSTMVIQDPKGLITAIDNGTLEKKFQNAGLKIDPDMMRTLRNNAESRSGAQDKMLGDQITDLVKSDVSSLISTGEGVNSPLLNKNAFVAAFGKDMGPVKFEQYQRNRTQAQTIFKALDESNLKPWPVVQGILKELEPKPGSATYAEDLQTYNEVVKEASRRQKLLHDDPFTQVNETLSKFDSVRMGFDTMGRPNPKGIVREDDYAKLAMNVTLQEIAGVPSERRRAMSNASAKDLVTKLNALAPDQLQSHLDGLERQYGAYYPMLYKQLVDQRLKMDHILIPWSVNTVSGNMIVEAVRVDMDTAKKASGLQEPDMKSVQEGVSAATAEFVKRVTRAGISAQRAAEVESLNNTLTKAVLLQVGQMGRQVGDVKAAIKQVVDPLIADRYHFENTYYIPKMIGEVAGAPGTGTAINIDFVKKSLDRMLSAGELKKFQPELMGSRNFYLPKNALEEGLIDHAISKGHWITNESGDGVYLAVNAGGFRSLAVRNRGGQRYEFKFRDLTQPGVVSGTIRTP